MSTDDQPARRRRSGVVTGLAGALWALLLLPPALVEWGDAPGWATRLNGTGPYVWIAERLEAAGITNTYAFWGIAAAVAFALIGVSLWIGTGQLGRWARATSVITLVGVPVVVASYLSEGAPQPWRYLWGSEFIILVAVGLTGLVAGIIAMRRLAPRWSGVLLAATMLFVAAGTIAFTYYPHGSLVGLGIEAPSSAPCQPPLPEPSPRRSDTLCNHCAARIRSTSTELTATGSQVRTLMSIYSDAGGFDAILALVGRWHELCLADSEAAHPFRGSRPRHNERFAAYLAEAFGGPALYTAGFGDESSVQRIHAGNRMHGAFTDKLVGLFHQAVTDVGIPEPAATAIRNYFAAATAGMAAYDEPGALVPEGLPLNTAVNEGITRA